MKLISMTEFVLEKTKDLKSGHEDVYSGEDYYFTANKFSGRLKIIENYAKFLKQPLELWMFVPCDEGGNVLDPRTELYEGIDPYQIADTVEYQKAKDRVLFDGKNTPDPKELVKFLFCVEDLARMRYDIDLTQMCEKRIGVL